MISGLGRSPGRGHGNLLQCSCLENPMDRGAWWATVHRVEKSQTGLNDFDFHFLGFPGSSAGKESTCSAGDPSSIPGSGRFPKEGIGYTLQCSWAFQVAQMVRNKTKQNKTDLLEEGMATHSSILTWRITMDRRAWWATVRGVAKSRTRLSTEHSTLGIFLRNFQCSCWFYLHRNPAGWLLSLAFHREGNRHRDAM